MGSGLLRWVVLGWGLGSGCCFGLDVMDVLEPMDSVEGVIEGIPLNNAGLAFEYAMDYLKMAKGAAASLNTRLGTVIGFAGISLRFALDLGVDGCLSCLLLKVGVCLLAIVAMGFGLWGIMPVATGLLVKPEVLLRDEWYGESDERVRVSLVETFAEAAKEIAYLNYVRAGRLRLAVLCLAAVAVLFGLDAILLGMVDFWC